MKLRYHGTVFSDSCIPYISNPSNVGCYEFLMNKILTNDRIMEIVLCIVDTSYQWSRNGIGTSLHMHILPVLTPNHIPGTGVPLVSRASQHCYLFKFPWYIHRNPV
jgi:hypothetical protein